MIVRASGPLLVELLEQGEEPLHRPEPSLLLSKTSPVKTSRSP